MSRRPRASGYFRTGYAQDLELIETRTERWTLAAFLILLARLSVPRLAVPARSRQPGFPGQHRRHRADAADRIRRPDLARPCRTARCRRLHGRHPVQGAQCPVLGDAAGGGARRRAARRRVRPAFAEAARPLSRGQHAGAALPGRLPRRRIRGKARVLHRHPDRRAQARAAGPSPAAAPGISSSGSLWRQRSSCASTCCAAAPAARGPQSAPTRRWRRRSASASPPTNCSLSSSARR